MSTPSRATEAAAADAARARSAWRKHVADCARCAQARHARAYLRDLARCPIGRDARAELVDAEQRLDDARAADRRPLPGQAELPLNLPGQLELYGDVLP